VEPLEKEEEKKERAGLGGRRNEFLPPKMGYPWRLES
jgi:hypothetical protein